MTPNRNAMIRRAPHYFACAVILVGLAAPVTAWAQPTTTWQVSPPASGDWFVPANWSSGIPSETSVGIVDNGGLVSIGSGAANAHGMRVGVNAGGNIDQSGGSLAVGYGSMDFGQEAGSIGRYALHNGSLTVIRGFRLGMKGNGEFDQYGGQVSLVDTLMAIGTAVGGEGNYRLHDGAFSAPVRLTVGGSGKGKFVQEGGTSEIGMLAIGGSVGSLGHYELSAGSLTTGSTLVGLAGTGSFAQTGGKHTATGFRVGELSGAGGQAATYQMSGDDSELFVVTETIGGLAAATFTQSAGTHEVASQLIVSSVQSSTFNLSGGSLKTAFVHIASNGNGVFNQSGGTHTVTETLNIGEQATSVPQTGEYNLSGGALNVQGDVRIGRNATGLFTQTGGTHHVEGDLIVGDFANGNYTMEDGLLAIEGDLRIGVRHAVEKRINIVGGLGEIHVGGDLIMGPSIDVFTRPTIQYTLDQTGATTLSIDGAAIMEGGRIRVEFADGFMPFLGQEFWLMTAQEGITGNLLVSGIGEAGGTFEVVRTPNAIVLVSLVPEPKTIVLAGFAMLALAWVARANRMRSRFSQTM